ncbi:hypothetical protein PZN02_004099 [Sinorhizobium garamanticum]|uniref:Uncharacterized protein n=1 Tax=Sinorhizobium garamanticum TaxID=680247 RepID=A0ABY8DLV9_9HYPH|nr:hypothetical protein [Sinorhizobium garamanticum]WEX90550.1 hypothetical protein PZN02_004099 [Sinorhizobium garamanticum]
MRFFVLAVAILALAAAPCAWDSDPREPSAISALFGGPPPWPGAGSLPEGPTPAFGALER